MSLLGVLNPVPIDGEDVQHSVEVHVTYIDTVDLPPPPPPGYRSAVSVFYALSAIFVFVFNCCFITSLVCLSGCLCIRKK